MGHHRHLIESRASIMQYEAIQKLIQDAERSFSSDRVAEVDRRLREVKLWLSHFDSKVAHESHQEARKSTPGSGRWLLKKKAFLEWFAPERFHAPILWLSGIPGAGKTVLASIVVDHCLKAASNPVVAYFYCKYLKSDRNSFVSVARSLLSQILAQERTLLDYLYEKSAMAHGVHLSSFEEAKELLRVALQNCKSSYIIIDGLDECTAEDRKRIANFALSVAGEQATGDASRTRWFIVSQDDGVSRHLLRRIPEIKVTAQENKEDLQTFAIILHEELARKFPGQFRTAESHIANIITARSQGMRPSQLTRDPFARLLSNTV
jgi:adenylylsulfate kinase-like enzyme